MISRVDNSSFVIRIPWKPHLPGGKVKNRIHYPDNKITLPWAIRHYFVRTLPMHICASEIKIKRDNHPLRNQGIIEGSFFNTKIFFFIFRVASRLTFIPFVVGPPSPNGVEQQQQAETTWKARYDEAPMALGPLLAINVADVIEKGKCLKREIAGLYPDFDDRICENYGLLLAMASEVK